MTHTAIARVIATRVLHRIATEDAWASPTLDAEIERARLSGGQAERDAALATQIVYGTLRVLPSVDRAIAAKVARKGSLEPVAQAALRAATFQLMHLRTPPHAVVSDAVTIVRQQRGEGLARFTNAVLRKIAEQRPERPEPPAELEVAPWLAAEIERGLGSPERTRSFLRARALPPPIALRVSTERIDRAELAERIRAARPDAVVREGRLSPLALTVSRAGDPRSLPGWDEGLFAVQDEGSQVVALLLGARPGEAIADACAGRGGKTALLAARVGPSGRVTAIDLHEPKLDRIPGELARLGLGTTPLGLDAIDLSVGSGGLDDRFDRVLVDAPCTGLGTVHRRPEILLRVAPGDPARMASLQRSIAVHAARMVRPGGVLAVAVCSPTRAEGPDLADAIERDVPGLVRLRERVEPIALDPDADGVFRIGPFSASAGEAVTGPEAATEAATDAATEADGPDAYQIVRYQRRT